jgi:hypothetical protein
VLATRSELPCRAAHFKWETVSAILRMRFSPALMPQSQPDQTEQDLARLSRTSARRMPLFWQVRKPACDRLRGNLLFCWISFVSVGDCED